MIGGKWGEVLLRISVPFVAVFGFWYLAIAFSGLPDFVLPRPEQVLAALIEDRAMIAKHTVYTLQATALGLLLSNIVGILIAMIVTSVPTLNLLIMPVAITIRNIPFVALATILALAIGDTMTSKALLLTTAGFFPVMVNTIKGIQSVDPVILDRMRILGASPWRVFWQVKIRYSLPYIMAAQEIVSSVSIAIAIAAEWMLSSSGLGFVINRAMSQYRGDQVYAVALLAAALAYIFYLAIHFANKKINWQDATNSRNQT